MSRKSRRWKAIKRDDFNRVLVTETLPFETPIIFSGDGIYVHASQQASPQSIAGTLFACLVSGASMPKEPALTNPYQYKIRKGESEVRRLKVLHPRSQWKVRQFYKEHQSLILYFCSRSLSTLRAPQRQTTSFYLRAGEATNNLWKNGRIATQEEDLSLRYSPSFFTYRGYDRLYKFFESSEFLQLEKRYDCLWSLDISRCFDSIYTHSLGWAIYGKLHVKQHLQASTFADKFDKLMQGLNSKETNGIVIGPEVSRIFAEIILQSVDLRSIGDACRKQTLVYGEDFEIRRYVDDIFIFAQSWAVAELVYGHYSNALLEFNLQINPAKSLRIERPFITTKTKVTWDIMSALDKFFSLMFEVQNTRLVPKKLSDVRGITKDFIQLVKSVCADGEALYSDVSVFIMGGLLSRVKRMRLPKRNRLDTEVQATYRDAFLIVLEIAFFLYTVSPSIQASYRLSTLLIIVAEMAKQKVHDHAEQIGEEMHRLIVELVRSEVRLDSAATPVKGHEGLVSLEIINVLLATHCLGPELRISQELAGKVFDFSEKGDYFHLVSCLFYVQNDPRYAEVKAKALTALEAKLSSLEDIYADAEKACLFLDSLTCPYIPDVDRHNLLDRFYVASGMKPPTAEEAIAFFATAPQRPWFVNWNGAEMQNLLERKELVSTY